MDVPDWVWDEARPVLSSSELLVVLAVLRHGGGPNREVHEGRVRARVKVTTRQLATMAGVSVRTIENGFDQGGLGRFVQRSNATERGAARSFSVYYQGQCAGAEAYIFRPADHEAVYQVLKPVEKARPR